MTQQLPDWLEAMVPDVARALCNNDGANWCAQNIGQTPAGETPDEMRDGYRDAARAALAEAAPKIVERMAGIAYDSLHPHPNHPESDWTEYGHANAMAAKKAANAIRREVNRDA